MASRRQTQQKEIQFRVMRLLEANPTITNREVAEKVGISNGAAYYCIHALVEKGFVKLDNFAKSGKKSRYLYELTPRGLRQKALLTSQFLAQKIHEYHILKAEILQLEFEEHLLKKLKEQKSKS